MSADRGSGNGATGCPPLVVGLVMAAAFLSFLPALRNGFVAWDDRMNLLYNPDFRGLDWRHIRWMFTTTFAGPYQPLCWLTFAADYRLWGLDPTGYHLTNLVLHTVNAGLFCVLAIRLLDRAVPSAAGGDRRRLCLAAGFAALLFAVHPLRVESVAWATERKDVLSGLFTLLTVWCYLRMCAAVARARRWYLLCLGTYLLALLSKGSAVSLPASLVVLDLYPLQRLPGSPRDWALPAYRRIWLEKVPFLLLALAFGVIGFRGLSSIGDVPPWTLGDFARMLGTSAYASVFYLSKSLLPVGLSPLYESTPPLDAQAWPFVLAAAVVALLSGALWRLRGRWPAGLAAWAHYLATLVPTFGASRYGNHIAADRYTYLSCLGGPLLIGAGWYLWARRSDACAGWRRAWPSLALGLVVWALAAATWRQTGIWHDSKSLWSHAVSVDPGGRIARMKLSRAIASDGNPNPTIMHFAGLVRRRPDDATLRVHLGLALAGDGRRGEAIVQFREALRCDPRQPVAQNLLGKLLAEPRPGPRP